MSQYALKDSIFLPYYPRIRKRQIYYERELKALVGRPYSEDQLKRAEQLAVEFVYIPNGYFCSSILESVFLKAAANIEDVECCPTSNTVLHVMTQADSSGGHTRVVDRWIRNSPAEEVHSIVILAQGSQGKAVIPQWLYEAVEERNGSLISFPEMDIIHRAEKLRKIASKYERIVLHVHMNDGTPIVAFGVESFKTPIILFNHADHLFWLGTSIADIVADLQDGNRTPIRRCVDNYFTLGIPLDKCVCETTSQFEKQRLRKEFGIPSDAFVCITTASAHKLRRIGRICMDSLFLKIVNNYNNVICLVIGVTNSIDGWQHIEEESYNKVRLLGEIRDKSIYYNYLKVADVYLGSFPYMSYTAIMDGVQTGMPFLQLHYFRNWDCEFFQGKREFMCYSVKELLRKLKEMMQNHDYYESVKSASAEWLTEYSDIDAWKSRLKELYQRCSKKHSIHSFINKKGADVFIDDQVALNSFGLGSSLEYGNNPLGWLSHLWIRMKFR